LRYVVQREPSQVRKEATLNIEKRARKSQGRGNS